MTIEGIGAAKKSVRRHVLALRDALSGDARERKSAQVTARLLELPAFAGAATVAAYSSFGTEFDTGFFLAAVLARGKNLVLPRVARERKELVFHFVTDPAQSLLPGKWGIREPDPAQCADAELDEIDFMLVPGVAFTRRGERLGYGGGFYDAAISATRTDVVKVAAAFAVQIVNELPLEPHDRRVDLVVTEDAEYPPMPAGIEGGSTLR
jgi:5-formyltetrahydrofolate cyclo-ligase